MQYVIDDAYDYKIGQLWIAVRDFSCKGGACPDDVQVRQSEKEQCVHEERAYESDFGIR